MLAQRFRVSERRACMVLGVWRSAYRYEALPRDDEEPLRAEVIRLASRYGRYGYRMIAALLRNAGWIQATPDRVERIWREEGLKVAQKQPKRGRLWMNEGSCIRLRAERHNHLWSYDFVSVRDAQGHPLGLLRLIDEYTRECLAIHGARNIGADQVIEVLAELMLERGIPEHVRSDNGPEFIAARLRHWLQGLQVKPLYIEPGSPWENGYCESFNGTLRDELPDGELFYGLKELRVIVGNWVKHYNTERPHSSLGYRPPAPQAWHPRQARGASGPAPMQIVH